MKLDKYTLYYRIFITTFWVMWCWGFVSQQLVPPLGKFNTYELILIDAVWLGLGIVTLRNKGDLLVLGSFVLLAVGSTKLANHLSWFDLLNGSRDFVGLLFMVPILRWFLTSRHARQFVADFDKHLYAWMWVQAFCASWQFARYGACDQVGGSMGNWASGILTVSLFLVSFYFVRRNWDPDHYWRSLRHNLQYIILLYPIMLNETKSSFIFLLVYFVLLMRFDRTFVMRLFLIIPAFIAGLAMLMTVYFDVTDQDPEDVFSIAFLDEYLLSGGEDLDNTVDMAERYQDGEFDDALEIDWWTMDVPRFAKIILSIPVIGRQPGDIWLGAGLGHLKNGQHAKQTSFGKEYGWLYAGTVVWSLFVFVAFGLVGLVWMIVVFGWQLFGGRRPATAFDRRMLAFLTFAVSFIMVYNDSFRVPMMCSLYAYFAMFCHYDPCHEPEKELEPAPKVVPVNPSPAAAAPPAAPSA